MMLAILKERGLENGIDAASQTDFLTDLDTVDGIQVNIVVGDELLHLAGQPLIQLLHIPGTVQKEVSALLQILDNVILVYIRGVVAGYEVSLADIIGGFDRLMTETQVGYSQTAGLLGVVGEVALSVHIGVVADDLDGVLVGTDSTVRTEAQNLQLIVPSVSTAIGISGMERWVTSSMMPKVKWFFGWRASMLLNTA